MDAERGAQVLLYGTMILLPLAALIARRPRFGQMARMAAGWIAIFAFALLLVGQRDRLGGFLSDQHVAGGQTRIRMAADGHFWADVTIDGVARRMLIDSGATTTALSEATARAAGIDTASSPFGSAIETANGRVVARNGVIRRLTIGAVTITDVAVVVSPSFGTTDVIGMNVLSRLGGWRLEGKVLILTP